MLQSTAAIRTPSIRKTTILRSIGWLKKGGSKLWNPLIYSYALGRILLHVGTGQKGQKWGLKYDT
jgi:hypothetical protein